MCANACHINLLRCALPFQKWPGYQASSASPLSLSTNFQQFDCSVRVLPHQRPKCFGLNEVSRDTRNGILAACWREPRQQVSSFLSRWPTSSHGAAAGDRGPPRFDYRDGPSRPGMLDQTNSIPIDAHWSAHPVAHEWTDRIIPRFKLSDPKRSRLYRFGQLIGLGRSAALQRPKSGSTGISMSGTIAWV